MRTRGVVKHLTSTTLALALLCGCSSDGRYSSARSHIRRLIPGGARRLEQSDTHGGFHGDGRLWQVYELPGELASRFREGAADSANWQPLPLPDELRRLSGMYHDRLPWNAGAGFYYFHDFQPEWYPDYESLARPVADRPSCNFLIIIFDSRSGKIFVDNLDT